MAYVKIQDDQGRQFILAESRVQYFIKMTKIAKHTVIEKYQGKDLVGQKYVPLFNYFEYMKEQKCFAVISGDFVTSDTGTGIVHMAPGFGEDDY